MHDDRLISRKDDSLRSALLATVPGIIHGFGTRKNPVPPSFQSRWNEDLRPSWKQVHGREVREVLEAAQACGETDGLFTRKPNLPIGVLTADCVSLLLARKDGSAVAALHAGWRGTRARITESLFQTLRQHGDSPRNWVAAIGPCAGPCCYPVSPELMEDFVREFGPSVRTGERNLNLPEANRLQLEKLGVPEIELLKVCTLCSRDTSGAFQFESFRRDAGKGRQISLISRVAG